MKKSIALLLTLLLLVPTVLSMIPAGSLAETVATQITETTEGYEGSLGYGDVIRKKSDGSIMFSPFITELYAAVEAGASLSDYTIEMTFTLLKGDSGAALHTFDTVSAALNKGNGKYYDIFLNGTKGNTGFCPTAGEYYDIYVEILKGDATVLYGTYSSIMASSAISGSAYYVPTAAPQIGEQITETKDDYTGDIGYKGGIRVKSDSSIMFSPYITELMALYDAGENMSDYTAELTFVLLTEDGSAVEHTFDPVSASLTKSNSYFDMYLNGTKESSGFCPTAGRSYDITVEIYKDYGTADAALVLFGTYKGVEAPEDLADSSYYAPTPTKVQITETVEGYEGSIVYKTGIRKNSAGNVLFSPFMTELRSAVVDGGKDYSNFTIKADFALLDDEDSTKVVHIFEDIVLTPSQSNGYYVDIVLQSSSVDCGFCPTADKSYNIYLEVYEGETLRYYGEYKNITAGSDIADSSHYMPSAVPGAPVEYNISLSYSFNNELPGSAAGKIFVTVDQPGYFALYWGDGEGKPLTTVAGDKTLSYSALNSFVITDEAGGKFTEKVLGFTAIPVGAETLLVLDSAKNILKSLSLPQDKLLENTAPDYSFGVVSDVHFKYFYDTTGTIDHAVGAFDTALAFYKAAGTKLIAAVGDYSKYAEIEAYQAFYDAVDKSDMLVIACGGNHELYASLDVMFGENGYWRTYMNTGIYDGSVEGVLDIADNGIDFTYQIPGVEDAVFVSLSQWYWDGHSPSQGKLVEPEQLVWLEEQFEEHKDKTVYFMFHTYLSDDDHENIDGQGDLKNPGGYSYNGHYNTYVEDEQILRDLLTEYDNVVWFNGHSHYEYSMQMFNENLNIFDYQGTTATMIHVPSLTNPRTLTASSTNYGSLHGEASQGALMFVYDGYQIMNGLDLWGEEILAYACYIVYDDKTDIIETGSIQGTDITWTYDAQLNSLRILGTGEIPAYTDTAAPWAKYANSILSVYVGSGITAIDAEAFADLSVLEKAELKEGIITIGEKAFANTALSHLILPESLKTVADGAFSGISAIETIAYGGTAESWQLVTIGEENDCLSGTVEYGKVQITFVAGNTTVILDVKVGDVPVYDGIPVKDHADETKHYLFTGWSDGSKTYTTTDDLPKAAANATYTALFESEVDRYVTGTISDGAITWTLDRKTATLTISGAGDMPSYAASTDQPWAAYGSEIRIAVVKTGVTSVGKNAFSRLAALETVIIEEGVTTLAMDALAYNSNLETIHIPVSLKTVGQGSVYQSNNIATIYFGGTEAQWNALCASITTMYNTNLTGAKNVVCASDDSCWHFDIVWEFDAASHWYICEDCGKTYEAAAHTYGQWTVTKEATETEKGSASRVCECGHKETKEIPATGSDPDVSPKTFDQTTLYVLISFAAIGGMALCVTLLKKRYTF